MQQTFNLDEKSREEALDPTQSFIVQAPAGSGKTGLLVLRLLVLLSIVKEAPEECLAITFTRKAAAEMRDRIMFALQRATDPNPPTDVYEKKLWQLARTVLVRDQHFGWDLLENPNRVKIQTIDAFCAGITRQMPILSQFGSSPKIIEDGSELYRCAARNLLKTLESNERWSEAVRILLLHLDNNLSMAERLLSEMLSHRDQWLPYIGLTFSVENARGLLEAGLRTVIRDTLGLLRSSIPKGFEQILTLARLAAEHLALLQKEGKKSCILQCRYLSEEWPGGEVEDLSLWQGLGELLLTEDHEWRKTVTEQQGFKAPSRATHPSDKAYLKAIKDQMRHFLEKLPQYPMFRENLARMRECPREAYHEDQWSVVDALVQLLPVLTAELSLVFQENGQVDFTEITLAALKALGDSGSPTDLALGLDYKIHHILIDEFQDTSLSQFRLIEQLTAGWQLNDGRTLFLVGDPMQSIYRFRQAEVGLFIRARQKGVGEIALKSLNLTTNFRSDPKIVAWTNAIFKDKFPIQDDITSGAIAFSDSQAVRLENSNTIAESRFVTVETEAEIVTALIKSLQLEDPTSSIALLVRSRTHLQRILPSLREAAIEYRGIDLELLTDQPVVQDLLALTKALLHLGDRIAWLSLLRTPWVQLSLQDLFVVANFDLKLPLWHALQSYTQLSSLSERGKARLAEIVPILSNALLHSHSLPFRKWIMETWEALGGVQSLYSAQSIQDAEAFLAILEEDHNFYEIGVLEQRVKSLYAKTISLDLNTVQIMTIHKAKGLEFDTVIVPGVGRKSLLDPAKLLLWEERVSLFRENYFILAPIKSVDSEKDPIYAYLKQQEKHRTEHEATRVEYVAATRARKRLYWLTHKE